MTKVIRFDAGSLQKPRRTSQGYLRVDGWASRTGILEYRNPDGTIRRELREDNAVFADDSLTGFEGAPVTDDHPSEMVTIHNAKTLTKGTVLSVGRRDGDHVAVSLVITDPDLIKKMESGKRQLSTGYYVTLDETPGTHPKYGRYDARQVKVGPVNHLAVVERGRAGTAAVRMDGGSWHGTCIAHEVCHNDSIMDLEAALARIKELEEINARVEGERDAARKDAEDSKAEAAKEVEAAKSEAIQARKDSEDAMAKALRDGLDVLNKATNTLPADFKIDGKDLVDCDLDAVKRAVVKHIDGDDIAADKHPAYIDGRFEAALKRKDAGAQALAAARKTVDTNGQSTQTERSDADLNPEAEASKKNRERLQNAWQTADK